MSDTLSNWQKIRLSYPTYKYGNNANQTSPAYLPTSGWDSSRMNTNSNIVDATDPSWGGNSNLGVNIQGNLENLGQANFSNILGNNSALSWNGAFGGTDPISKLHNSGWVSPLLRLGKGGLDAWLGIQKLGLAKDDLKFQKDAFSKQFDTQKTLTNTEMEDRQRARVSFSPAAESVDSYMARNRVK